jgi:hypothetical protein
MKQKSECLIKNDKMSNKKQTVHTDRSMKTIFP